MAKSDEVFDKINKRAWEVARMGLDGAELKQNEVDGVELGIAAGVAATFEFLSEGHVDLDETIARKIKEREEEEAAG